MMKGVLTVGVWTMGSRVLGFARDMLIAYLLGAGPIADAFFVANKLPNLFRRLFGEGAFNAAFVPAFAGLLTAEGPEAARRFAEEAFSVMAFWLGSITIVGIIFMPALVTVLAPGFTEAPEKFALAVDLARITFPYLVLICLTALLSGVLNGMERFAAAAASQVVYNLVSIAFMLLLTPYVPNAGYALAYGVSVSGVAQLALVGWGVMHAGMALRIPRPRLTPNMRILLRRMGPGLLGASATQLSQAVDVIIMSLLPPGTVSLLYYADRVNQLPLGVIGTAVGTAMLPLLSRQVRAGEGADAINTLNRAIEYALFLTLPAAVALTISAEPIISVLFGRGAFDAQAAYLSSQALAAYAIGLPAIVLIKVLAPGFFARGDTMTPMKIGLTAIAINVALNIAFMIPLKHVGPALATSLAAMVNTAMLATVLAKRGQLKADPRLLRRLPRMAAAATAMGLVLWWFQRTGFAALNIPGWHRFAGLALLVTLGMATYAAAGQLLGAFDLREAGRMVRRRGGRVSKQGEGALPPSTPH
jgi:putative peptidoglycan lipid II flippase